MNQTGSSTAGMDPHTRKSAQAFRTISEVADELEVPQHVLRFWETKFSQVRPLKRGGGRRYYRPEDVRLLARIRSLLYDDGYTIKGVQKVLKESGVKGLLAATVEPAGGDGMTASQRQAVRQALDALIGLKTELARVRGD